MPRIPIRTEPYTSPARQQRHYKAKRDRTLKQLGSASHINGSQFAIILVNAKGDVETYGSELFKPRLTDWFDEAVKTEARRILFDEQKRKASLPQESQRLVEVELAADEDAELYHVSSDVLAFGADLSPPPAYLNTIHEYPVTKPEIVTPTSSPAKSARPSPPHLSPVDVELANRLFQNAALEAAEVTPNTGLVPFTPSTLVGSAASPGGTDTTTSALDEWFCNKFHVLQQNTCKLVAKCWIKVIEPKKQNKFPYQKGDDSRPDWWPVGIRHKEPDHLIKPERNALLLALLKCGRAPIARLELSTAEAMAHIQPEKFTILREIYEMAKEQEMRRADPNYKPRIPLTTVIAPTRGGTPVDDTYTPSSTLEKRPRSPDENDNGPRKMLKRLTVDTTMAEDDCPTTRRSSGTRRRRGPASAGLLPPAPFHQPLPFAHHLPHVDGFSSSVPDVSLPHGQPWPQQPHPFPFPTAHLLPGAFPYGPHHDAQAELTRTFSAPILTTGANPFADQFGEALATMPPPSPNTIAMMMWGGYPQELAPAAPIMDATEAPLPGPPSYPQPIDSHHTWDLHQLVEGSQEMNQHPEALASPPQISRQPSTSQEALESVETAWLM